MYPLCRLPTRSNKTLVKSQVRWRHSARVSVRSNRPSVYFSNSRSVAVYELGPLQTGTNYVTPQRNSTAQKCQCNTVMFRYVMNLDAHPEQALTIESPSLYMACTGCQNVTTQPWTFWSQFCGQVYVTQYPETIPMNTAVPHWAFLDYTVRNRYRWWRAISPTTHLFGLGWRQVRSCESGVCRGSTRDACTGSFDCFTLS